MKTTPDALGSVENESGKEDMKMAPDGLNTAENESGCAKYANGTRRPGYHEK